MELTGLGGGIMLAIAAALWLVYLVPSWLKRREYEAAERNAMRLQQTIRVLAETTEAPTQALKRAPAGPVAVGRPVQPAPRPAPQVLAAQRLRRTRMLATLVLVGSVIVGLVQVGVMVGTGGASGGWLIVAGAALAAVCALALLARLAEVSRARRTPVAERRTSQGVIDHDLEVAEEPVRTEWTPIPVPKPMYLSRGEAPAVARVSASELAEQLRRAAAEAEEALRAAEPPAVEPAAASESPSAPPSRFASMGIVDASAMGTPDLDAALERRRAG